MALIPVKSEPSIVTFIARLCSLGWSWWLVLEWCERKTLLTGWWLEAGAGAV